MYVNPFIFGILCTIGTEILIVLGAALISIWKEKRVKK